MRVTVTLQRIESYIFELPFECMRVTVTLQRIESYIFELPFACMRVTVTLLSKKPAHLLPADGRGCVASLERDATRGVWRETYLSLVRRRRDYAASSVVRCRWPQTHQ
jgi:hypothetical protein